MKKSVHSYTVDKMSWNLGFHGVNNGGPGFSSHLRIAQVNERKQTFEKGHWSVLLLSYIIFMSESHALSCRDLQQPGTTPSPVSSQPSW